MRGEFVHDYADFRADLLTIIAPNNNYGGYVFPTKDACGNPLVYQNGGYIPSSCSFDMNKYPPMISKEQFCQGLAIASVPLSFVGVPEVATYLKVAPAAARFLAWVGVGGSVAGLACM